MLPFAGVGMGAELLNITDTLARANTTQQAVVTSLDALMMRIQELTSRLTVAETVYSTARNCCESIRPASCPDGINRTRLTSTASYMRFDNGHSGAEPFDFNDDL